MILTNNKELEIKQNISLIDTIVSFMNKSPDSQKRIPYVLE